jgi:striatin 1/3/4
MRFLQIEWHNHERARNAWDIERAEMMAKIVKHEGETPMLRRQVEVLEKHIRMLEQALKVERAKSRALAAGDKPSVEEEQPKEVKGKNAVKSESKGIAKRELHLLPTQDECRQLTLLPSPEQTPQLVPERRYWRPERIGKGCAC